MRSVVQELNDLILSQPQLKVVVYNGQLDLIVTTLGTDAWLDTLISVDGFQLSPKKQWRSGNDHSLLGFKKNWSNLAYYVVLNAGHMMPLDAPNAGLQLLRETIDLQ